MYTWLVVGISREKIESITLVSLSLKGGLSPDIGTIDQMRTIERDQEIPHRGGFCDLMWSDPEDIRLVWQYHLEELDGYSEKNQQNQFMFNNQLTLICRAHQLVQEGELNLEFKMVRLYFFKNVKQIRVSMRNAIQVEMIMISILLQTDILEYCVLTTISIKKITFYFCDRN